MISALYRRKHFKFLKRVNRDDEQEGKCLSLNDKNQSSEGKDGEGNLLNDAKKSGGGNGKNHTGRNPKSKSNGKIL